MAEENKEEPAEALSLRLNFRVPGRMPTVYAHHMFVQPGEHEVVISFFEVIPPLVMGDTEEQIMALQETGVVAECVARITVAKNRFPGFVVAMQQIMERISSEQEEEKPNADSGGNNQESQ